ncbi:MAG TPA: cyclase family protein [Dehalococcoidia bacterium]|jgi:arylformamidase|nr:cyclase family protein [Dehalococcoidia bacterium]
MTIYDVSLSLRPGMPTYAGEPGPVLDFQKLIARGDSANVSVLSLGSHTGTHVDAPHHFLDGESTVEEMIPEALIGPACVWEQTEERHVTARDLEAGSIPADCKRLLLKTPNSRFWEHDDFHTDFVGLTGEAARWLVDRDFVLVGIDYLSIEEFRAPTHEVHRVLLESGVVIVEGLDLRRVPEGVYTMVCAPLKVVGAEGAPARVFLWD